jgi:hypothetical protein
MVRCRRATAVHRIGSRASILVPSGPRDFPSPSRVMSILGEEGAYLASASRMLRIAIFDGFYVRSLYLRCIG